MKLKNSYILLIMFLFLLISIGSVCASENITNDDTISSGETEKIHIKDESDDLIKVENTTIKTDKDSYNFTTDENITLNIHVNNADNAEVGYTNNSLKFIFDGNDSDYQMIKNRYDVTLLKNLKIGYHTLLINYTGSEEFASSHKIVNLTITNPEEIIMPTLIIYNDNGNITIPITITNGLINRTISNDDDIKVNFTYVDSEGNIKYINSSKRNNGSIIIEEVPTFIKANISITLVKTNSTKNAIVKYNATINASDELFIRKNQSQEIDIQIFDGKGNLINTSDIKVYEGSKLISNNSSYKNHTFIIPNTLGAGKHNLTIVFGGDNDTYIPSNKTLILNLIGNVTFTVNSTTKINSSSIANLQIHLLNGPDLLYIQKDNLTLTLVYTDENNSNHTVIITDFNINQATQIINFTVSQKFIKAHLLVNYITEDVKANLTSEIKVETFIIANDTFEKGTDSTLNFDLNVTAANIALNITKDYLKVYNGATLLNITYNKGILVITDKLGIGVYNLNVNFTGNDIFMQAYKTITLKVIGFANTETTINVNSTKKAEIKLNITDKKTTYNVNLKDLNISVFQKIGNQTVYLNYTNLKISGNTLSFILDNLNFTQVNLTINYRNLSTFNTTLKRVYAVVAEVINNQAYYKSGNFTYRIKEINTGEYIANKNIVLSFSLQWGGITFVNNINAMTDENGVVVFENSKIYVDGLGVPLLLGLGNNSVTLSGTDLTFSNGTQQVFINQAPIGISIDPYREEYGSSQKVIIRVFNSITLESMNNVAIHLYLSEANQHYYFSTNSEGISEVGVTGLVSGTYTITVDNTNDTVNMTYASVKGSIIIVPIPVKMNVDFSSGYYNSGYTGKITITRDGKALSGVYVQVRVYVTSTKFNDVVLQTDAKGKITFSADLSVGKHKIVVRTIDTRYSASSVSKNIKIKKAKAKLSASKTTAYYKQNKEFTVKVTNKKTKDKIYGASLKVKLTSSKAKYKAFKMTSGANGKAKFNSYGVIPGVYKVVITGADSKNFKASKLTSKLVVKKSPAKLSANSLTAKKGEDKKFTVKAINKKTKKPLYQLKLKIKVGSKKYTVTTDSHGVATLSTKSLGTGNYKVTISSSNKYCPASKAKSTIKIQ